MDDPRVLSLLDRLEQYEKELSKHLPVTLIDYSKDLEKRRFVERTLQLLIETCIDTCQLLVKELKLGLPEEEESLFEKLREAGVVSKKMAATLSDMKKFRNVLIHHYAKIEDAKVFQHATKQHSDFVDFKREVLGFLNKSKKQIC